MVSHPGLKNHELVSRGSSVYHPTLIIELSILEKKLRHGGKKSEENITTLNKVVSRSISKKI